MSRTWVIIDFGIGIKYGNLDTQIAGQKYTKEQPRRASANNDNLYRLVAVKTTECCIRTWLILGMLN
jgi:hypothetical protein